MAQAQATRKLPRCVYKGELTTYFDCPPDYLWRNLITEDLLQEWGFQIEDIKPLKLLPHDLTERIYIHFKITDLTEDYQERILRIISNQKECLLQQAV